MTNTCVSGEGASARTLSGQRCSLAHHSVADITTHGRERFPKARRCRQQIRQPSCPAGGRLTKANKRPRRGSWMARGAGGGSRGGLSPCAATAFSRSSGAKQGDWYEYMTIISSCSFNFCSEKFPRKHGHFIAYFSSSEIPHARGQKRILKSLLCADHVGSIYEYAALHGLQHMLGLSYKYARWVDWNTHNGPMCPSHAHTLVWTQDFA